MDVKYFSILLSKELRAAYGNNCLHIGQVSPNSLPTASELASNGEGGMHVWLDRDSTLSLASVCQSATASSPEVESLSLHPYHQGTQGRWPGQPVESCANLHSDTFDYWITQKR